MKKVLLVCVLIMVAVNCSGCMTILGGIIGYQSGEALAGAAIGAGIDITGTIISHMHNKEKEKKQQEEQKEREIKLKEAIKIFPEEGFVRVGSISAGGKIYSEELKKKFDNMGWQYSEVSNEQSPEISKKTFACKTSENKEFTLELMRETNQDLLIFIKPAETNKEFQSMVTSQVGIWIREIAGQ